MEHSKLGASSASRWIACPASVQMSEGIKDKPNEFSIDGSVAHWVASESLIKGVDPHSFIGAVCPDFPEEEVTEEMCDAVDQYVKEVRFHLKAYEAEGHTDAQLSVEVKFDLGHVHEGMFGTCDAIIHFPAKRSMIVFDYKHGVVAVDPEFNEQLMFYALGAWSSVKGKPVADITLVIVQPNGLSKAGVKSWNCGVMDLFDYGVTLKQAALKTEDKTPVFKTGDHCKYCKAAAICPALENEVASVSLTEFNDHKVKELPLAESLTPEQLSAVYASASVIKNWIKSVEAYAFDQVMQGVALPGLKVVKGKGLKAWTNEPEAKEALLAFVEGEGIETPVVTEKLITPTQAIKLMGKGESRKIADFWAVKEGKLTLALDSDPRPSAIVNAVDEFALLDLTLVTK